MTRRASRALRGSSSEAGIGIRAQPPRIAGGVVPDDAELLHAEAQRVGMQAEPLGGIAVAVDAPPAVAQHVLDVRTLDRLAKRLSLSWDPAFA